MVQLFTDNLPKLTHHIFLPCVCVYVHGNRCACVSHDILQGFDVHPRYTHVRAKSMAQDVRRNVGQLLIVCPVVFCNTMVEYRVDVVMSRYVATAIDEHELFRLQHNNAA